MKQPIALPALFLAALLATACANGPRPLLSDPEVTVAAMRDAWEKDNVGLFLHTLGRPVLKEYSEHRLRLGWSSIRPLVGDFVSSARVVEIADYPAQPLTEYASGSWVWPEPGAPLKRVRLISEGEVEDFLFALETDDPPEQAIQARGFYIGDRYYVRTEHMSAATYLFVDSPESERTHWRLIFPYQPFQLDGPLTQRLIDRMGAD
jgi:hypothetical protein